MTTRNIGTESKIRWGFAGASSRIPLSIVVGMSILLGPVFAPSLQAQVRRGHGLLVNVDTTWVNGPGYYPVRITVTPTARAARDRRLRLEFAPNGDLLSAAVSACDVVIPASGGSVSTTLSVATFAPWQTFTLRVYEGGARELEKLAYESQSPATKQLVPTQWGFGWNERYPAILLVGDKSPDASNLIEALTQQVNGAGFQFQVAGSMQSANLPAMPLDQLPRRWINYSTLDVICLSMDNLAKLVDEHPGRAEAIRSWVAAGGNLWLYGVGDRFAGIAELERLLDLSLPLRSMDRVSKSAPSDAQEEDTSWLEGLARRGWTQPTSDSLNRLGNRGNRSMRLSRPNGDQTGSEKQPSSTKEDAEADADGKSDAGKAPIFLHHPLELGRVAAFASDDPFSQPADDWRWVFDSQQARWRWVQRHGLNVWGGNADFVKFLIPGVGEVPVTMFNVLITIFVVAIGPVIYWMLRRRRRLHLLIVTVPLCAGLVTVALVVYAMVADGFSIQTRARSYTQIDQQRGEAVSWTRLSYYAGLAPSGGLVFSSDTLVLPLSQGKSFTGGNRGPQKFTYWDQKQRLQRGWLPSRTPTQFVTVRVRPTQSRLVVHQSDADGPLVVENRLGTRIDHLLLVGSEGDVFEGSAIESDETGVLDPREARLALAALQERLHSHQLRVPPGMLAARASPFGRGAVWGMFASAGDQATGLLESSLNRLESMRPSELEPGSYIALVQRSPELQFGLDRLDEEKGLHVVVGRW